MRYSINESVTIALAVSLVVHNRATLKDVHPPETWDWQPVAPFETFRKGGS